MKWQTDELLTQDRAYCAGELFSFLIALQALIRRTDSYSYRIKKVVLFVLTQNYISVFILRFFVYFPFYTFTYCWQSMCSLLFKLIFIFTLLVSVSQIHSISRPVLLLFGQCFMYYKIDDFH